MTRGEISNFASLVHAKTTPIPPRYCWLKRIVIASVVLLIVLGMVRWRWGVYARTRLQAEIDRYVAAGEPVYPEDFLLPWIPDDQNAAILMAEVAQKSRKLQWPTPADRRAPPQSLFERAADPATLSVLADAADLLAAAREAARMPAVYWSVEPPPPSGHDRVIEAMILQALAEQRQGNTPAALVWVQDALRYARHLAGQRTLMAALVYGAALRNLADVLEEILPSIGPPHGGDSLQTQSLREARGLLDELQRDDLQEAYCFGFYRERAFLLSSVQMVVDDPSALGAKGLRSWWGRLLVPMMELDAIGILRRSSCIAEAMAARDYATYLKLRPSPPPAFSMNLKTSSRILRAFLSPDFEGVCIRCYEGFPRQRMAVLGLAASLFRVENGRLPTELNELVPRYLADLPDNPYDPAGFTLDLAADRPCIRAPGLKDAKLSVFHLDAKARAVGDTDRVRDTFGGKPRRPDQGRGGQDDLPPSGPRAGWPCGCLRHNSSRPRTRDPFG